nr:site-specific integrase [uncultured Macellibacteroides sp.]
MAIVRLYFDTRRAKQDGTFPVKVVVAHNAAISFHTGVSATEEQWTGSELNKKADNYKTKNSIIRDKLYKIESVVLSLERNSSLKNMSDKKLKDKIEESIKGKKGKTFIDIHDSFVNNKQNKRTKEIYTSTRNKITAIDKDVTFTEMDVNWLHEFDNSMMNDGLSINARAIHMRNIRAVFNYAIDNDIIDLNVYPFRKFKIKKQQTPKRSLLDDQLKLIRDYDGPLKEYADFFMLSFYLIGINIIDIIHVKEIVNGRIEYYRAKTGRFYSIEVSEEAKHIIDAHRGSEYLLKWRERYTDYTGFKFRVNLNLKKLTFKRNNMVQPICEDLTTYYARHTWATIASRIDIPKETISAALGHGGNTVTDVYIDFDMKKVDEANKKVIDYVLNI